VVSLWQRWQHRQGGGADRARRWVVLDVESSGLDPRQDRLLAVAAVALQAGPDRLSLCPADSFEAVLRQPDSAVGPDRANILVHGIGLQAQRQGQAPAQVLTAFQAYVADAPLVAFHAAFDRALLDRPFQALLGRPLRNPWLDLADLAPAVCPKVRAQALDDWLSHFGIEVAVRHQAAADSWATAELLQRLWPLARSQGCGPRFRDLARLAASRRWLAG
jgi:DNA polymerase III subunit epsilon